jgi:pimeloyl-ACP methyl ester carboxylesterase
MDRLDKNMIHQEDLSQYCAPGTEWEEGWLAVSDKVSLRLITFRRRTVNNNPSILFVAGWVSQIKAWQEVLLEMTQDFNVYYLETREKISSRICQNVEYNVETIGKDIITVISKLAFSEKSYILFGSSLGATSIIDCCRLLKKNPLCLILISPNAEFRVPKIWLVIVKLFYPPLYELIKPPAKWYLRTFRLDLEVDYEQYEKYCKAIDAGDPWKLKKAVLSLAKYTVWDKLKFVKYPTLLIGASKDKLHEPDNLKKMIQKIHNISHIDLKTNKLTHSRGMVDEVRSYIKSL